MADDIEKGADGFLGRGIGGHNGAVRSLVGGVVTAQPACERRTASRGQPRPAGRRHILRRRDGGRRMDDEHGVRVAVSEHHLERRQVALREGIPADIERIPVRARRRQQRFEPAPGIVTEYGELAPTVDQRIRRHHPRTPAVAHDRKARTSVRLEAREHLGRIEKLSCRVDSQNPRAT